LQSTLNFPLRRWDRATAYFPCSVSGLF
jgi:hypothetical protein